jgi:catechol-2,3-dioxygenase
MSRTIGISAVVLQVTDIAKAGRFYSEVVGLVRDPNAPGEHLGWTWFWAGKPGDHERVGLHQGKMQFIEHSPLSDAQPGPVHFALHVPDERLDEFLERFKKNRVDLNGPVHHNWTHAISYYFFDIDGNLGELFSPSSSMR